MWALIMYNFFHISEGILLAHFPLKKKKNVLFVLWFNVPFNDISVMLRWRKVVKKKDSEKNEPHHEKINNVVSKQVRHKPSCTGIEDG